MKKIIFISFLVSCQFVISQKNNENYLKNAFFLEFSGHSETLLSVNYERFFFFKNKNFISSLRIGAGRSPGYEVNDYDFKGVTSIPLVVSMIYGKNHYVQFGVGTTFVFSENFTDTSVNPNVIYQKFQNDYSLSVGYRYMTKDGIVAQIYPIAIFKDNPESKFALSFGVGLGYSW